MPTVVPDGTGGLYVSGLLLRYGFVGSNYVVLPTLYSDHRRSDGGMASGWPPSGLANEFRARVPEADWRRSLEALASRRRTPHDVAAELVALATGALREGAAGE